METLNTLKYANRARNIKNKVTANQDKTSRTILMLRKEIQNLQFELMEYRQGKRVIGMDGEEGLNDMYHENTMLNSETANLRTRVKAMQETIDVLTAKNAQLLAERETGNWIGTGEANQDITSMIAKYMSEIEELRTKLCESENLCEQLRKESSKQKRISANFGQAKMPWLADSSFSHEKDESGYSVKELIDMAKQELEKKQEKVRRTSNQTGKKEDEEKEADEGECCWMKNERRLECLSRPVRCNHLSAWRSPLKLTTAQFDLYSPFAEQSFSSPHLYCYFAISQRILQARRLMMRMKGRKMRIVTLIQSPRQRS